MNINTYKDFVEWERKLDELCEILLLWRILHDKSCKEENIHFVGHILGKDSIVILYYVYDALMGQACIPGDICNWKYEPKPMISYWPYEVFEKDFDELKDKYSQEIYEMRLKHK